MSSRPGWERHKLGEKEEKTSAKCEKRPLKKSPERKPTMKGVRQRTSEWPVRIVYNMLRRVYYFDFDFLTRSFIRSSAPPRTPRVDLS